MLSLREKELSKGLSWPIGTIVYSHAEGGAGLLPLDGSYYDPTDPRYRKLFRRIGFRFGKNAQGHFRVPLIKHYLSVHNGASSSNLFVEQPATMRWHRHGSGSTSHAGDHSHSESVTTGKIITGTPGTNGTGTPNCTIAPSTPTLPACGNHTHSASTGSNVGVSDWRPLSVCTNGFIVCGSA